MNASPALRLAPLLLLLTSLVAAPDANHAPVDAKPLPIFSVAPEFILIMPMPHPEAATMRDAAVFRSVDERPWATMRQAVKYRSVSLRAGDEIVSVNGKPFSAMSRTEFQRALYSRPPSEKITLEVRQPASKEIRRATVVRVFHPEDRFADDAALKQFAEFARPACIFNERGKVLFDAGAERSIESIVVDDRSPQSDDDLRQLPHRIIVRFKAPRGPAPLLMLADSYQAQVTTEQKSDREWIYTLEFARGEGSTPLKVCRFRISI